MKCLKEQTNSLLIKLREQVYVMAKSVVTCFHILKPIMNQWVQYPAQHEA